MQELAILLSSIAGAASAVAVKKFPKDTTKLQSIGASSHIKNQINSLKIEKDILNKTIARLYDDSSDLSKIQKDRLLLKYQHQLGIILAKLDKLEVAKRHPDLGPVGDGLITLMDQKLSQLDNRLYELSSKITASAPQIVEPKKEVKSTTEKSNPIKKMQETFKFDNPDKSKRVSSVEIPSTRKRPIEITTLTTVPKHTPKYPLEEEIIEKPKVEVPKPKEIITEKEEILQTSAQISKPEFKIPDPKEEQLKLPSPKSLPKPEETKEIPKKTEGTEEDDTDDLEKIKGEILKTLSKLEQAEVE